MKYFVPLTLTTILLLAAAPQRLRAESGEDAWLRYAPLARADAAKYDSLPATVSALGDSTVITTAQAELIRGVKGMLGRTLRAENGAPTESAFVLGTLADIHTAAPALALPAKLSGDGFVVATGRVHGFACTIIAGADERGVLYGVFAFLSKMARNENIAILNNDVQQPAVPLRWVNEWDNINGTIEKGFGGRSIFFDNGAVRPDLTRVDEYARLLASVGINGCAINNVNANPAVLNDDFLPQVARIADVFRRWGIQLALSVAVNSPKVVGGLDSFDPLDPKVAEFWRAKTDQIYSLIPDFGGFVVKADSEGRAGPSTYGRTPADAANVIARALKPHGGVLFYRAFVYDNHLDWTNLKNDRARAAYDIFHPLDGQFDDNVIVQIKNGPIDFQVREPASPLFGGLKKTNEAIELQIVQEYTGQERHLCFLVPMWKTTLDFDMHADAAAATPVKDLVSGKTFNRPAGGFVGVSNVGLDPTWDGYALAMANLYGFGRLAWNPNLSASAIADEWTRLTFGNDPLVVRTITAMQLASWHVYELYTGPLGAGTLTNITGAHYGPAPQSAENNGWGQWVRADHDAVGMDRTIATGTGYIGQYSPAVQKLYESPAACPDNLLLFFHHVPYTYVLHSGKTVIQHVYDSHYEGAEDAAQFVSQWKSLAGRVDDDRYAAVLARLEYQSGHAIVWRDAVDDWFLAKSGIPDARGRVDHNPGRIEAESMQLQGYVPFDVTPPEAASGGKAIQCSAPAQKCTASFAFSGAAGRYELDVEYFDQANGVSKFRVYINDQSVDSWLADDHLPALKPNADSSTRRRIPGLALRPGDKIRIEGIPDGMELAPLDYVEIHRERQ